MSEDLTFIPAVHPRRKAVHDAGAELEFTLERLREQYALTPSEEFMLLGGAVRRLGEMCVNAERREPKADE